MKKIKFLWIWIAVLLYIPNLSFGQYQKLNIGDTIPNIVIKNLLNTAKTEITKEDMKGKLIILSFWSTACSSCIADMPKMDSLQKKFSNELLILLVTNQKKEEIKKFWEKNHITKAVDLPTVTNDTQLSTLFEHYGVPFEVWLDQKGVVKGLTTGQYVNEENITKLLNNEAVDWPINKKLNQKYNFNIPLIKSIYTPTEDKRPIYYSVILPSIKGVSSNYKAAGVSDSLIQTKRFFYINFSILDLYRSALQFEKSFIGSKNRILLEVRDSLRYIYDRKKIYREDWLNKNAFCYDAVYPITLSNQEFKEAMLQNLNSTFNINARVEERIVDCWILISADKIGANFPETSAEKLKLKNTTYKNVSMLLKSLNYREENPPVIDETGNKKELNIRLKGSTTNFNELKEDLHRYGLDIIKTKRKIEMFILSER